VRFTAILNESNLPCDDLQELGIYSTFFGAWWGQIEPEPGQYDWSAVDEPVDAALACGMEPVVKISTGAKPGEDGTPPEDMEAYSDFVYSLAQHLKGSHQACRPGYPGAGQRFHQWGLHSGPDKRALASRSGGRGFGHAERL
jgi:hypothetical protein